jgi:hypothetical protein
MHIHICPVEIAAFLGILTSAKLAITYLKSYLIKESHDPRRAAPQGR